MVQNLDVLVKILSTVQGARLLKVFFNTFQPFLLMEFHRYLSYFTLVYTFFVDGKKQSGNRTKNILNYKFITLQKEKKERIFFFYYWLYFLCKALLHENSLKKNPEGSVKTYIYIYIYIYTHTQSIDLKVHLDILQGNLRKE